MDEKKVTKAEQGQGNDFLQETAQDVAPILTSGKIVEGDGNVDEKEQQTEKTFLEETAQDVAPILTSPVGATAANDDNKRVARTEDKREVAKGIGWLALALSILSLFILPVLLAAGGIITGFIARRRGLTGIGNWAIGIGLVSLIVQLFVAPFFVI